MVQSAYDICFMVLYTTLMACVTQCVPKIISVISQMIHWVTGHIAPPETDHKSSVKLIWVTSQSCHGESSRGGQKYQAIIYALSKISKSNLKHIKECYMGGDQTGREMNYLIDHTQPICLDSTKKLYIKASTSNVATHNDNANMSGNIIHNTLCVYSTKLTTFELVEQINTYMAEYTIHREQYHNPGFLSYFQLLCIVNPNYNSKTKQRDTQASLELHDFKNSFFWNAMPFKSSKTFDKVFFDGKEEFEERLHEFTTSEEEYTRRALPYNLHILLTGEAGCGKTSIIKAILNSCKRHVCSVSMGKIQTCNQFVELFNNLFINGAYIPMRERIYIFEDIDCMGSSVLKRTDPSSLNEETVESEDAFEPLTVSQLKHELKDALQDELKDKKNSSYQREKDTDKMNMACFLNTLDGVNEYPGRIIIATTNHPEMLDEAVLRRFELKLELTRASDTSANQLINHYYDTNVAYLENIGGKWTPCKLIEYCKMHRNVEDMLKFIEKAQ